MWEARDNEGLSREKVAALVGLSSKTIERYEKANEAPLHRVVALAAVYNTRVDALRFYAKPARRKAAA